MTTPGCLDGSISLAAVSAAAGDGATSTRTAAGAGAGARRSWRRRHFDAHGGRRCSGRYAARHPYAPAILLDFDLGQTGLIQELVQLVDEFMVDDRLG